jgi:transposase
LEQVKQAARDNECRLLYLDEAGFSASPPIQRSWSPLGLPHAIEPKSHCRRSVIGALDFGTNCLHHNTHTGTIKRGDVVAFLDQVLAKSPSVLPTLIVLDNARIHHHIDQEDIDRWLIQHHAVLIYLPPYSPELNLIEIIWKQAKYFWRRFVTWTAANFDQELLQLFNGYGTGQFLVSYS